MAHHRHRRRRRPHVRIGTANCLICSFRSYRPMDDDDCANPDPVVRETHVALMRAGRVGRIETPIMKALAVVGRQRFRLQPKDHVA